MDKNTVLIAEQVGLFLIPTLREIAKAQFADSFAAVQAALSETRTAAEQSRATLAGDIVSLRAEFDGVLRNIEKTLEGLASLDSVSDLRLESRAAIESLKAVVDARLDTLETGLLSTAAGLKALENTELKTITIKAEPDYVAISAEVNRSVAAAVQAIKLPEPIAPDLGPVLEECRATVASEVRAAVPALRESLAVNIADEVARAVPAAVQAIKLPEPVAPDLGPLLEACRDTLRGEVESMAPALRDSLAVNIADEVARAVPAAVRTIKLPDPIEPDLGPVLEACRAAITLEVDTAVPAFLRGLPDNIRAEVASAVSRIKLPELDMLEVAGECQSAAAAAVAAALPQLRESLSLNVRDEVSRTVAALPKPKDGEPGPAGLMAAAEPYIEGEVYERLALVSHAGGTWQATRRTKTAPAANLGDWQAIAVGVARVSAQAGDDLRTVEVVAALTDGTESKHVVEVPAMVYRDVYDEAEAYGQADVVTHAGSLWLALKDTKGETPSKSPEAWRLIVKRGQDGRAGKDGDHGVQFQAGYAGEYEEDHAYPKNSIVTYSGSTWLSKRPTKERPPYLTNADNDHWLRLR